MVRMRKWPIAILLIASTAMAATNLKQDAGFEEGRRAYEAT